MDSVIINGEEPKLLQLTVWFESRYEKNCKVTIQVGNRAPLIHSDYLPYARVYFYDIALRNQLPTITLTYNSRKLSLDLGSYQEGVAATLRQEDVTACFIYELMNETGKLEQKYWSVKQPEDKVARGQGLTNFVRAESQFLALFERDEEVQQIRAAQIEEEKIERDISDQIINLRRSKIEFKVIAVLILLFVIAGFLFQAFQHDPSMLLSPLPRRTAKGKKSGKKGRK